MTRNQRYDKIIQNIVEGKCIYLHLTNMIQGRTYERYGYDSVLVRR